MLISEVTELSSQDRLTYWIRERESIRLKKEASDPKPWTDDEILQRYRFCNVRRMDDKVSQWLLKNWYDPHFNHPNMLVACTLARHFNQPKALLAIGFPEIWRPERIKQIMRGMKANGERIFNGAYMVRGIGTADKTEMVVDRVCQPLVDNPPLLDHNSTQGCVEALLSYWGFSWFMAGQVVADLRWAAVGSWKDRRQWASVGPGSRRGMNRLLGRPPKKPMGQDEFLEHLRWVRKTCEQLLDGSITRRLEAIDYQNCLCEYDKYSRVLLGEGRPKQLYPGRA